MAESEPFELIGSFYTGEPVIDRWTHVFSEQNPLNGYYTMLATSDTDFDSPEFEDWWDRQTDKELEPYDE